MAKATTPMMRQYRRIRDELPDDVVLFFRLGDFYEMFFDDACRAAPVLDVALTKRNGMPMCGVPYHAVDLYLAKLLRAGIKVAVCEQVEDPATAKGVVRREVARIVTPGTATEDTMLEAARHQYLAGLFADGDGPVGLALLDLSTGLFWVEEAASPAEAADALRRLAPTECVLPEGLAGAPALAPVRQVFGAGQLTAGEDWTFDYEAARDFLRRHFGVTSLDGFGCEGRRRAVAAAGAVLHYVKQTLRRQVAHVRSLQVRQAGDTLALDDATCANLDLVPRRGTGPAASLLQVLDATRTPMGARQLRDWLLRPLLNVEAITRRHEAVGLFTEERARLHAVREALAGVRDLERLIARLSAGGGNARDVQALGRSLAAVPALAEALRGAGAALLTATADRLRPEPALVARIEQTLADEPPPTLRDGGIIRAGFHAELDALRRDASSGRTWLAEFQAAEQERTGIRNLKVRHNKVFGYYIEVTRGQLDNVPAHYQRRQTLVNAERFITPELKDYESRILGAQGRALELELELFAHLREAVVEHTASIQATAEAVAVLDVLAALADRALALGYTRPAVNDGPAIRIRGGRHPVIEQMPEAERFVPNDTLLDNTADQLIIITGPNMAGKSTYIRQVGLIVVMAQLGSFVPADAAEIGVVDRVFTRVGASDDLARGRSTFMVEMQETANILNNATSRSLLILDEIGRGTSTFDGISIAWAVAEHLHNETRVKAKTLFATHYHELTDLARTLPGVRNYNVLVRESGDRIAFLRRIVPGAADKSYGIQVARLAGMPVPVIDRAREILANLEEGEFGESGQPQLARHRNRRGARPSGAQLDLFG